MIKLIVGRWYARFKMGKVIGLMCCLALSGAGSLAHAQKGLLDGYWKQKGKSVYIKVVNLDGVYHAEVVRDDWSPGLVGSMYFSNVETTGKPGRWAGEAPVVGTDRIAKATLKLTRDDELSVRIRRGTKLLWVRSEPVEKRY